MNPPRMNPKKTLIENILIFSAFLKENGYRIFPSGVLESVHALKELNVCDRELFFSSLRANLCTSEYEWTRFRDMFENFWVQNNGEDKSSEKENELPSPREDIRQENIEAIVEAFFPRMGEAEDQEGMEDTEKFYDGVTYSPVSFITKKDISGFDTHEIPVARMLLKNMLLPFRIQLSRRYQQTKKRAMMDFKRIIRKSLKTEGIPFEILYQKKKRRLKRLVVIADVSGSMDRYASFVISFIMGIRQISSKTEVFVFSTSLSHVTKILRRYSIEEALKRMSQEVPDWSGGTRIGYSLHQFNQGWGRDLLGKRSVVIVMSDGWDLGGRKLLIREMEAIRKNSNCVIWLNPLIGENKDQPLSQGMKSVLPYIDYLMPANNLESLRRVGRVISKVILH